MKGVRDFEASFVLPYSPLVSITSVEYRNTSGDWTTFAAENYEADTKATPGEIRFKTDDFPDLYEDDGELANDRVRITYVSGYGAAYTSVPEDLQMAILTRVSTLYTHRETLTDLQLKDISKFFAPLTAAKRVMRY